MRTKSVPLIKVVLLQLFLFCVSGVVWAKAFGKPVIYQADGRPDAIAVADFNSDGNVDLAVTNFATNDVSILLGLGDGTFLPTVNYLVGAGPEAITVSCETLAIGSRIDLAVTNYIGGSVSVLAGNGDGTFQPAVDYSIGDGTFPVKIVGSVDFNGDGNCDLAVAVGLGGMSGNGSVAILLGNGDGSFQPAVNYNTLGIQPNGITSGDFNGDLSPDLAVTDVLSADFTVLLNNGSGGFTASRSYRVGTSPYAITTYAGNNLVVAAGSSAEISLLRGNGDGTFTDVRNFPVGVFPLALTQAFVNGDSTPDIVIADQNDSDVYVLLGKSSPQLGFRRPLAFNACAGPQSIVAFDFNHDGKTDLAVACGNGVGIMLNTGP